MPSSDKVALEEKKSLLPSKPCQSLSIKDCSMNSVVVYRDRAEVKRLASVNLSGGESEVIFNGLSEAVDGDSIRVEGQGQAKILDVIYSTKEEKKEIDETEGEDVYKGLVEQIKEKEKELKHLQFREEAIEKQKELLERYAKHVVQIEKLGKVTGQDDVSTGSFPSLVSPNSVSAVMEFMEQYEGHLASLDERSEELKVIKKKITEEKNVLVKKADEVNPKKKGDTSETIRSIKVTLEAEEECEVMLVLSYVVSNCSWTPAYDIRVFTQDKTMKLHYYGMIKQSTGEDWNNTNISLSTAQPDIGGSAPQLGVHHIGFVRPRAVAVKTKGLRFFGASPSYFVDEYDPTIEDSYECFDEDSDEEEMVHQERYRALSSGAMNKMKKKKGRRASSSSLEVTVAKVDSGQLFNTTYKIPRTSTIPADNTEHKVTVAIIDLTPEFSYISVPKMSEHSFLQAKVKNVSPYAFLTGPANVFLDNNFLAKTELSATSPGEEFTCSLGVDQSIRITTHPVTVVRGTTGRLTKNNLITYTRVVTVKNTQANAVKLKVMEQVPLSSDERLKVVVIEPDLKKQGVRVQFSHGSVHLNEDNNVEWACTIPPDTGIDLRLVFSVEFPPNDIVEGLQS